MCYVFNIIILTAKYKKKKYFNNNKSLPLELFFFINIIISITIQL